MGGQRTLGGVVESAKDGAEVLDRVDLGAVLGDSGGGKGHGEDGEGAHLCWLMCARWGGG